MENETFIIVLRSGDKFRVNRQFAGAAVAKKEKQLELNDSNGNFIARVNSDYIMAVVNSNYISDYSTIHDLTKPYKGRL